MKINYKQIFILVFLIVVLLLPYFVFAADPPNPLNRLKGVAEAGGYSPETSNTSMAEMVGTVINAFLSLLGVIFLVLMLYAGYNWMTASGDEAKLEKSKNTIRRAIIGLIVTVGSWGIWRFILSALFANN